MINAEVELSDAAPRADAKDASAKIINGDPPRLPKESYLKFQSSLRLVRGVGCSSSHGLLQAE